MPSASGASVVPRLIGLLTLVSLAGAAGQYLHLRSVSPQGVRDEQVAKGIVAGTAQAAGLQILREDSAPAARAGMRDSVDFDAPTPEGVPAANQRADALARCLAEEESGLRRRVYRSLFGVELRNQERETAEAAAILGDGEGLPAALPFTLVILSVATTASEEDAVELLSEARSERFAPCLAQTLAGVGGQAVQPLPAELGPDAVGFRLDFSGAAPVPGVMDFVVTRTGRGLGGVAFLGVGQPYPPEREQVVLALLSQEMAAALAAG